MDRVEPGRAIPDVYGRSHCNLRLQRTRKAKQTLAQYLIQGILKYKPKIMPAWFGLGIVKRFRPLYDLISMRPARFCAYLSPGGKRNDVSLIRILVSEHNALLMDGIASELRSQSGMEIVGQATSAAQLVQRFLEDRPDVTLVDLEFSETELKEAIARILAEQPRASLIGLTTYEFGSGARAAMGAGLRIILAKDQIAKTLAGLVRALAAGELH